MVQNPYFWGKKPEKLNESEDFGNLFKYGSNIYSRHSFLVLCVTKYMANDILKI